MGHIVMLHKAYPPIVGGIERHVGDVSEALVRRGWKVTALVCGMPWTATQEWRNGVRVIRAPRWGRLLSQPLTWGYYRRLGELNPDLVHVHLPFPLGWFAWRNKPQNVPLLCTWHSDIVRQRLLMPVLREIEARFLEQCSRIIATSPNLIDSSKALQRFRDKTTAIPLSLPDQSQDARLDEGEAERLNGLPRPFVLFVGRLVGYKGLPVLLKAMQSVDAPLVVAGDGPLRSRLERFSASVGLNDRIHWLGHVSEAAKTWLYRNARMLVLPSTGRNEAFGYVLLEAMREGCPLVTSDLPTGVTYANRDEETGLTFPLWNAVELANAIKRILGDDELHRRFSVAARQRYEREFGFKKTIDSLEVVYRESLSGAIR